MAAADEKPLFAAKLHILYRIIEDIDGNSRLEKMLGDPPSKQLALVVKKDDFGIVGLSTKKLTADEEGEFLTILSKIMEKHIRA